MSALELQAMAAEAICYALDALEQDNEEEARGYMDLAATYNLMAREAKS